MKTRTKIIIAVIILAVIVTAVIMYRKNKAMKPTLPAKTDPLAGKPRTSGREDNTERPGAATE